MSLGRSGHAGSPAIAERLAIYDDPAAAHRAMLALDAGRMGSWRLDILTDMVTGDQVFADFFQFDPRQQPWPSSMVFGAIAKDDLPHVQAEFDKALQGAEFYEAEFRTIFPTPPGGLVKWIGGRGTVTERSDDGEALVMIGVNWDATLQKQHEERLAIVASEMDHRIRNDYAVICALIKMGEHVASDKTSLSDTLLTQIHAMAETHVLSLLTDPGQANVQSRIVFGDIVRSALAPWLSLTHDENRLAIDLHIETDDTITLCAHRASSVAMLVFELTSHAAKYGALGDIGGQLTAQVVKAANDKATFSWAEKRSPNAALRRVEIASDGFGKTLIQHCVGSLGGVCEQSVTDGGFSLELTMPMGDT